MESYELSIMIISFVIGYVIASITILTHQKKYLCHLHKYSNNFLMTKSKHRCMAETMYHTQCKNYT